MTNSFTLYKGPENICLNEICSRLTTYYDAVNIFDLEDISLGFSHAFEPANYFEQDNLTIWLIPTANDTIVRQYDLSGLAKGLKNEIFDQINTFNTPSFIAFDQERNRLFAYNSPPGFLPLYYGQTAKGFWLTSEAKSLINNPYFELKLRPYQHFESLNYTVQLTDESIFEDLFRLKSNHLLVIDNDLKKKVISQIEPEYSLPENSEQIWKDQLFHHLNHALNISIPESANIGLALSGGYDSGSIAGLMKLQQIPFQSFTIGSEATNEFKEAQKVSEFANVKNTKITISEETYLKTYLEATFLNEINDPVIAEAFVGIYCTYESAAISCNNILTGYGADILLGNLFDQKPENIYAVACKVLSRASTSGELSPFIADRFNINSHPIYLRNEVVKFCLQIPGHLKIKDGVNKYIQRALLDEYDLLPKELLKIKKKGLHEGAGLPEIFAKLLNIDFKDYSTKRRFLYNSLQLLFEEGIPVDKIDVHALINKTKIK